MKDVRGILLAGGRGTRLYPVTSVSSKQLQPIYNKPMIYYSLTTLLVAGVREVLIISSPEDLPAYERLLGDGSQWGIALSYAEQAEPNGIAEAFIIGADFIGDRPSMLMLGDNLIYGRLDFLREAIRDNGPDEATILAYQVADPSAYGVVEFGADMKAISLEEKPQVPKSSWAIPGIYVYAPGVAELAKTLKPSARGELEITDLNRLYLEQDRLHVSKMGRGVAWLDTGTPENLLAASNFVHAVESRQGLIIGSPEEAAFRMGYLDAKTFRDCIAGQPNCDYRDYLARIADDADTASIAPPRPLRRN